MTSIVLAGGRSLRLRRDKLSVAIGGESLIQRVIGRLALLENEIIVVISQSQIRFPFPLDSKVETVVDLCPSRGSLVGIYTGLRRAESFHNLVVAGDMPFLNLDLLRYMIDISPGFDAVVPRLGGMAEPLHAIYSKNCLAPIERGLKLGNFKLADLFDSVRVRYLEEAEVELFDPEHLSFFNVNTQADLERARALVEQETLGGILKDDHS